MGTDGYFREHLFLFNRVEQVEIPSQRREVEDHLLRFVVRCALQHRFCYPPDHVGRLSVARGIDRTSVPG